MKRLFISMLCCSLLLLAVPAQAQFLGLIKKAVEKYTPGKITFKDGHEETYRWVQIPADGVKAIKVSNDAKKKEKTTIPAEEILSVTLWNEKTPDKQGVLFHVHTDKSQWGKPQDAWGSPIASSAWGTVYRCCPIYSIDKKTGELMEEHLMRRTNMGNGAYMMEPIPANCYLVCVKYENAQWIGTSPRGMNTLFFNGWKPKETAAFFAENETVSEAIAKRSLTGADIQFILDEMAGNGKAQEDAASKIDADVVVMPEYSKEERGTLFDYTTWLKRVGLSKESQRLSELSRSSNSGTALLVKTAIEDCYIIAPRDVIGYAKTATVVCKTPDGQLRYENCKVAGTDTARNVVFVDLPDDACGDMPADDSLEVHQKYLKKDYRDLSRCAEIDGEAWLKLMAQLPDKKIKQLAGKNYAMPLDIVLETMTIGKGQLKKDKKGKTRVKSRTGLVSDIRRFSVGLYYDNYISPVKMSQGLELDYALGRSRIGLFGVQIGSLITPAYRRTVFVGVPSTIDTTFALQFGLYGGAQVPLRVADRHLILPRATIGANFGPLFDRFENNKHQVESFLISTDTRIGCDYRYELDKLDIYFGVRYNFHFIATGGNLADQPLSNKGDFKPYIDHGVSAHMGVTF